MITRCSVALLLVGMLVENAAYGQRNRSEIGNVKVVRPQGDHAKVDTKPTRDMMRRLSSKDKAVKLKAVKEVKSSPNKFAPPALYLLSNELLRLGQKDDAMYWYYLGQLRARSDANKCNDVSARQAVEVLRAQYGQPINEYAFRNAQVDYKKNIDEIKSLTKKIIDWDRKQTREYDPRWISLHGIGAFTGGKAEFEPKERWADIDEETRVTYLKGIDAAVDLFREMDADGDGAVKKAEVERHSQREQEEMQREIERQAAETNFGEIEQEFDESEQPNPDAPERN